MYKRYRVSDAKSVRIADPVALLEKRYRVSDVRKVGTADPVALFRKCYSSKSDTGSKIINPLPGTVAW